MTPQPDDDRLIREVAGRLAQPKPLSPDFDARVMAAVRAARREGAWERAFRWLVEPRSVAVSPLGATLAAAGLAAVLLVGWLAAPRPGAFTAAAAASEPELVEFSLLLPAARSVALAGDFNGWDASRTPLEFNRSTGLWTAAVRLAPGRYSYSFVVDGARFVADPSAPRDTGDDFGAPSSVLIVGRGSAPAAGGAT
jgi:hypothetical protein